MHGEEGGVALRNVNYRDYNQPTYSTNAQGTYAHSPSKAKMLSLHSSFIPSNV
jgi:hypothetical protein